MATEPCAKVGSLQPKNGVLPLAKSNVAPCATFAHPTIFHHPSVTPKVKSRVMILFHVRFTFFRAHSEQRDTRRATVEQASRVIGAIELPHLQGNVETGKSEKQIVPPWAIH